MGELRRTTPPWEVPPELLKMLANMVRYAMPGGTVNLHLLDRSIDGERSGTITVDVDEAKRYLKGHRVTFAILDEG